MNNKRLFLMTILAIFLVITATISMASKASAPTNYSNLGSINNIEIASNDINEDDIQDMEMIIADGEILGDEYLGYMELQITFLSTNGIDAIKNAKSKTNTKVVTKPASKTTTNASTTKTTTPVATPTPAPATSSLPYYIKVNKTQNVVNIYTKDSEGNYTVPFKAMICSTGTSTPKAGTRYKITTYRRTWNGLKGNVYGQYAVQIVGNILFHSVPYTAKNNSSLEYWEYDKLGTKASLGCIRLTVQDAKWIYDNCAAGTWVEFYEDENPGPLGKPSAKKISDNELCRGWDPTDYVEGNPWHLNQEEQLPEEPIIENESIKPETEIDQINNTYSSGEVQTTLIETEETLTDNSFINTITYEEEPIFEENSEVKSEINDGINNTVEESFSVEFNM